MRWAGGRTTAAPMVFTSRQSSPLSAASGTYGGTIKRMAIKYELPAFLEGHVTREKYANWLGKKSAAHAKRDRKRSTDATATFNYKRQIHEAVCSSGGNDWYTGETLRWDQIGTYDNVASKAGRSVYKAGYALLPTVDHVLRLDGGWDFVICGWRTNDAKNDLSLTEFLAVCRLVIARHGQEAEIAASVTRVAEKATGST